MCRCRQTSLLLRCVLHPFVSIAGHRGVRGASVRHSQSQAFYFEKKSLLRASLTQTNHFLAILRASKRNAGGPVMYVVSPEPEL